MMMVGVQGGAGWCNNNKQLSMVRYGRYRMLVPNRANCPCAYGIVPFAHGYPSAYGAFSLCPYAYCSHFCCAQTENLPVPVWCLTFSYSARMGIIFVVYFHLFSNGHFPFLFGHQQLELLMPVCVLCITCLQARHVEPVFYTWKTVHFVGFFVGVQLSPSDAIGILLQRNPVMYHYFSAPSTG